MQCRDKLNELFGILNQLLDDHNLRKNLKLYNQDFFLNTENILLLNTYAEFKCPQLSHYIFLNFTFN